VRIAPVAAAALFILSLLAWLSSLNPGNGRYYRELQALDDFAKNERSLTREVLMARAGLSRSYDTLVHTTDAYEASLDKLRGIAREDEEERVAVEALATRARRQRELIEQFKSKNALLQNSFAYFGMFSSQLAASSHAPIAAAGTSLATAMLHLTLSTSQETVLEVQDGLKQLATLQNSADDGKSIRAVLAHGALLRDLVPATDAILKELTAAASTREQDAFHSLIVQRQRVAQASSRRYGLLLYVTSLALLGVLIYLGMKLRERAVTLRRHAAFEHIIAGISMRFINLQPHEIAAHVEHSLQRLAECIGADRAYFVVPGAPSTVYDWRRENVAFPHDWPEEAMQLASRVKPDNDGIIHLPRIAPADPYEPAKLLANAGLRGWLCIAGRYGKGKSGILGFDAVQAGTLTQYREAALFRMAFDAIANGVGRALLEREKERLESNLQHARRMETVGALASGVAHNFNNIIGAILGYAEMAGNQLNSGNRPTGYLSEISRAGERARALIKQILNFGRREGTRQHVCIRTLLQETSGLLKASLPSHVNLSVHILSEDAIVLAEPARLQQVILNLCNNAAQAMDDPGTIEIEVEMRETELPLRIRGGRLEPGRFVVISISDPGRGIEEATLSRIFEPFFTTRAEGNGLGLSTARQTVIEYGGSLEVTSTVGAGTRFDVWLPAACADDCDDVRRSDGSVALGRGQAVLLVQLNPALLLRDEEIVAALGYEPSGYSNAAAALEICRKMPTRFDAALLCPQPEVGAVLELAAALRERVPRLPVVLATASVRDLDARSLAASQIAELVHYPLASSEVAAALSRCLVR
jgi:signal transduction histidine kinase